MADIKATVAFFYTGYEYALKFLYSLLWRLDQLLINLTL